MSESWGDKLIVYLYDASGSPIGMMYRTTSYAINNFGIFWFEKNMQGDIVAVYNSSGTKVASYSYSNAWGIHSAVYSNGGASTGAQYNPFRYRGYYYDSDLDMYYLQSRYYDPNTCRFVNADGALYHSMLGYNLFAYCENNPVNMIDITGQYCVANMDDDGNPLNDWNLEGTSGSGYNASGNYVGPGSAYYNYAVRSLTASYDANLGGYHSNPVSSGITNTSYYFVPGAVSVTDDMAIDPQIKSSPYSNLKDPSNVGPGKDFTAEQKAKIIQQNRTNNGGVVKSDGSGNTLVKPQKSMRGVTPPSNEWQIDHIIPKSKGGTNSYSNAQVLSREENRIKWDT